MTTDELLKKFEAWYSQDFYAGTVPAPTWIEERNCYQMFTDHLAWNAYQAAYASRDSEVEALCKDAERYRWLVKNAEIIECRHWHWWNHDSDVIPIAERIDAAMLEDRT